MADLRYGSLILAVFLVLLADRVAFVESEERVTYLPGYNGPLPFELFTGYITVNETSGDNLFYYFIKSENNPAEDPLILWITGGPGCSGLSGLVFEIGPLRFRVEKYNGSLPTLMYHPYAFTKVASIIFIDSPVGTGFSYSLTEEGYQTGDLKTVHEAYIFLTKWLLNHPDFLSNPLYIGGDSYGGKIVPLLALQVMNGIEEERELFPNMKGYFVGNPIAENRFNASRITFAHDMGFVPDDLYEATKRSCHGQFYVPTNEECAMNIRIVEALYKDINLSQVLEFDCGFFWSPKVTKSIRSWQRTLEENQSYIPMALVPPLQCREYGYFLNWIWANDASVRKALHIRKGTTMEWERCNTTIMDDFVEDVESVVEYHQILTTKGYSCLVYSGDHDMGVPHIDTEGWISSLNYSILEEWRSWFVGSQVAGYTRRYAHNLTYATIKGGGHTAPEYRPKECYYMFYRWIVGQSL